MPRHRERAAIGVHRPHRDDRRTQGRLVIHQRHHLSRLHAGNGAFDHPQAQLDAFISFKERVLQQRDLHTAAGLPRRDRDHLRTQRVVHSTLCAATHHQRHDHIDTAHRTQGHTNHMHRRRVFTRGRFRQIKLHARPARRRFCARDHFRRNLIQPAHHHVIHPFAQVDRRREKSLRRRIRCRQLTGGDFHKNRPPAVARMTAQITRSIHMPIEVGELMPRARRRREGLARITRIGNAHHRITRQKPLARHPPQPALIELITAAHKTRMTAVHTGK